MSYMAEEFKKRLIRFSDNGITGIITVKLAHRNIVCFDGTEKVRLPGPIEEKANVPLEKCEDIVGMLIEENFFGDVVFDFRAGRIVEVGLMEIYKPDEIENRFPERRSKQCLSGC